MLKKYKKINIKFKNQVKMSKLKVKNSNKVIVSKLVNDKSKLKVVNNENVVIDNVKKIEDELIVEKLIELKKSFGFSCLIKDVRAINLFDDCGFGGKTLYISLKDRSIRDNCKVNDIYYFKENNYCLKLSYGKLSWIDLWKAIDEVVKLNGESSDFIIDTFEVKDSSRSSNSYVKVITNYVVKVEECFNSFFN